MGMVGAIRAELELNTRSFDDGMRRARSEMGEMNSSAKRSQHSLKLIERGALAVGGAVVAGIGASVGTAAKFEQSMARVAAVSGATGDEFSALEDAARDLGATTTFSASQAAEGMGFLAMAGFDATEIIASMPGVLNLASAAQMDLATTADIASNILTGFGLEAGEMDRAVDVLVKTMSTANTDLGQLGKLLCPAAEGSAA